MTAVLSTGAIVVLLALAGWMFGSFYERRHGGYKSMLAAELLERLAGRGRPQAF